MEDYNTNSDQYKTTPYNHNSNNYSNDYPSREYAPLYDPQARDNASIYTASLSAISGSGSCRRTCITRGKCTCGKNSC